MDFTLEDILREAKEVTEEDKRRWKLVSELMIEAGRVERIETPEALAQAVDKLAYEIAVRSYGSIMAGLNEEEAQETLRPDVEKMDDILYTIAFGSGIHINIIDAMVGVRCDYHTDKILEQITKQ